MVTVLQAHVSQDILVVYLTESMWSPKFRCVLRSNFCVAFLCCNSPKPCALAVCAQHRKRVFLHPARNCYLRGTKKNSINNLAAHCNVRCHGCRVGNSILISLSLYNRMPPFPHTHAHALFFVISECFLSQKARIVFIVVWWLFSRFFAKSVIIRTSNKGSSVVSSDSHREALMLIFGNILWLMNKRQQRPTKRWRFWRRSVDLKSWFHEQGMLALLNNINLPQHFLFNKIAKGY